MSLLKLLTNCLTKSVEKAKETNGNFNSYKNQYKRYSDDKLLDLFYKKQAKIFSNPTEVMAIAKLLQERGYDADTIKLLKNIK